MASNYLEYQINLKDLRLNRPIADSTGKFTVLTAGTATIATAYSDGQGTALTLPATLNNGVARFFLDSSIATFDFVVLTATGQARYLRGLTQSNQNIMIDPEQITQRLYLPFTTSLSGVVYPTGFSLSQNMLVKDCKMRVSVVDATAVVDVGVSTGAAKFLIGCSIATTGYRGSLDESISAVAILGSALALTATNTNVRKYYISPDATTGLPIVFQNNTASGGTAAPGQGFICLEYDRLVAP
jgi:hypothetical protein